MGVVADAAGDGAAGDGEAAHPAATDVPAHQAHAARAVAIRAGPLRRHAPTVTLDEHDAAKALGGLGARHAGDGVAGDHVDDGLAGTELVGEDVEREVGQPDGVAQALLKVFEAGARGRRGDRPHKGAVLGDKLARAVHAVRSGSERQVVEQQDVGALAWGDGAAALRRA